jgi:DNA (cytosine-5)-methyltransferase 1
LKKEGKMHELALFAGAGGGILGGTLLGWRTVCAVEFASFCARRLAQRQNEGNLPSFPIWDDVRTFDGRPWRGIVDVVSGGFPCQDISSAGKGAGIEGSRSGLWAEMARIIGEVGPEWVLVENSPLLTSRGLGTVLRDLAQMGFDAEWGVLGAVDAGAPHKRERIWIVANNPSNRREEGRKRGPYPSGEGKREFPFPTLENSASVEFKARTKSASVHVAIGEFQRLERLRSEAGKQEEPESGNDCTLSDAPCRGNGNIVSQSDFRKISESDGTASSARWWAAEPRLGRVAHGVAHRVDRLRAIGNGQVPAVAAMAFRILSERLLNAPQV